MTTMNIEKVRDEMAEHWDMDAATFDAHEVSTIFTQRTRSGEDTGWKEVDFKNAEGKVAFFIEFNADNEVWNFEYIKS